MNDGLLPEKLLALKREGAGRFLALLSSNIEENAQA